MHKVFVVPGHNTVNAHQYASKISDIVNDSTECDLILAIGGDNAMLRAIHKTENPNDVPFLGLNAGSVGFLMNDDMPETAQLFNELVSGSELINLWMLEAEITTTDGTTHNIHGFNDIYFTPDNGQSLKMELTIDDIHVDETIIGDGFVCSTPQGSTGYNRAARGKIIRPGSPIIQLTPLSCTIGERRSILDSFIESDTSTFKIEFLDGAFRQPRVMFDGDVFETGCQLKSIKIKKSAKTVNLMFGADFNFYDKIYRLKFHQ